MSQEQKLPTREQFKEWMKDSFEHIPKKTPRTVIVSENMWLKVAAKSNGLSDEEAINALNEAKEKEYERLLFSYYCPVTGITTNTYLIGKYEG